MRKQIASNRWLWELLQNAKDCAAGRPFSFSVKRKPSELVIQHDAGPFNLREIVALVEGDSSKHRRGETTGRFGKGFLVTHVISTEVRVRGTLLDEASTPFSFTFMMKRGGPQSAILDNINECAQALDNAALTEDAVNRLAEYTYYVSPKDESRAHINAALRNLESHAPYLFAFIPNLKSIKFVGEDEGERSFAVIDRPVVDSPPANTVGTRVLITDNGANRQVLAKHI